MGLDSIEIVMCVEETFGFDITDAESENLLTPRDLANIIMTKVPTIPQEQCEKQKIFFRLRRAFRSEIPNLRSDFKLDTKIKDIVTKEQWPIVWKKVRSKVGEEFWPNEVKLPGFFTHGPHTIRDLLLEIAWKLPTPLNSSAEAWTFEMVTLEVRRVLEQVLGETNFKLDAKFVEDLGMD